MRVIYKTYECQCVAQVVGGYWFLIPALTNRLLLTAVSMTTVEKQQQNFYNIFDHVKDKAYECCQIKT